MLVPLAVAKKGQQKVNKKIKVEMDGRVLEIEIEPGMEVTLSDGKISVRSVQALPWWINPVIYVQPQPNWTIPQTWPSWTVCTGTDIGMIKTSVA